MNTTRPDDGGLLHFLKEKKWGLLLILLVWMGLLGFKVFDPEAFKTTRLGWLGDPALFVLLPAAVVVEWVTFKKRLKEK